GALLIALDERGKDISSQDFANILQDGLNNSVPQIAFAIGGADGHSKELRQNASKIISFGKLTWPHQIARVMLSEQIYRGITIISGHPYHRA
ncbi:UNVERIFIED_CONTAM: hypothetical protein GTU68_054552, partial [Idotea baltica]|nr:hypothetical protein [Idotea baltica]